MITSDDIQCLEDEANEKPTQLVVIETMQFFEIEISLDVDPEDYVASDECRAICADKITSGMTDLEVDRVLREKDGNGDRISP